MSLTCSGTPAVSCIVSVYSTTNVDVGTYTVLIEATLDGTTVDTSVVFDITVIPYKTITPTSVANAYYKVGDTL